MTDKIFFDTNILVYLFDTFEKERHAAAKHLLSERRANSSLHISSQVINEFVNITTGKIKNPVSFEKQRNILKFLQFVFIISPLTLHTSLAAIDLKLGLGFPDSGFGDGKRVFRDLFGGYAA